MPMNTKNTGSSFFDESYQPPVFINNEKNSQKNRRYFLKSAAGMGAVVALSHFSANANPQGTLSHLIKTDPWLTLDATLNQLLPSSDTGPSASDIHATAYLYQVMTVQPTEQDERTFILKGVGWLNNYAQSQQSTSFAQLDFDKKEQLLRDISGSNAGQQWLNTLLGYLMEAMLAPQSYGGNPNGIGWQWLEHQAGFPLPEKGQRYFELPTRARINLLSHVEYKNISTPTNHGTKKA